MSESKIFICPFNQYHKLQEYRKWQFHITRCGDRRGKTVYACQYNTGHYFCDISRLIEHEAECEYRGKFRTRFDNTDPEIAKNRAPLECYCAYDVEHKFTTIQDKLDHEMECPKREEHDRKAE
jgi:hypothetical protein